MQRGGHREIKREDIRKVHAQDSAVAPRRKARGRELTRPPCQDSPPHILQKLPLRTFTTTPNSKLGNSTINKPFRGFPSHVASFENLKTPEIFNIFNRFTLHSDI